MPSAFITGATGQDGSYLVERLHELEWDVHALVRKASDPQEQAVPDHVELHVGDLLDPAGVARMIDEVEPDAIFNLAGVTSVAESWEHPDLTARLTGLAVNTLLEGAWAVQERTSKPVRFFQASSSELFGNPAETPQNEETPIRPVSPYGAAKAYAHHLVGVYRGRGLFAASAILYNHESPRRPSSFVTRKITSEVAKIATGASTKLVLGNLDAERDWGWAPDYVDAILRITLAEEADDFVVATGESHSVRQFVAAAFEAAGIEDWEHLIEVDERFNRPVDATTMLGDYTKVRELLGWRPTLGLSGIVARMVEHDLRLLSA